MFEKSLADALCAVIRRAGSAALSVRDQDRLSTQPKADGSPVTCADHESQSIILQGLLDITPGIPVIAEEDVTQESLSHTHDTYWLVDPLDGTRDFITGRDDFSVNMGLIRDGIPVFGLVYAPVHDDLVYGGTDFGAFRLFKSETTELVNEHARHTPPRVTLSIRDAKKNPIEKWVQDQVVSDILVHASAYKLALVATAQADFFLRTSVTYEWDTAAGDAILRALGGWLITPDGLPLGYRKKGLENGSFIATLGTIDEVKAFLKSANLDWPMAAQ